jgi:carbon-monoxide dehydrogenase small subunit
LEQIRVTMTVNGAVREIQTEPNKTLLYVLREDLGLTGTKDGCREGECGACTVLLDGELINSCLVLCGQADRREVLTIEGLAQNTKLHPVQTAFVEAGAVQCGFCTPGAILAAVALLSRTKNPTDQQVREALVGNLCRCTGYTKMLDAVRLAAEEMRDE